MPQVFGRGPCRFCEKTVTSCGFGEWNHLRMHYRQVFCKEPPSWYGVNDLTGALLKWRREAVAKAEEVRRFDLEDKRFDKVRATGVY